MKLFLCYAEEYFICKVIETGARQVHIIYNVVEGSRTVIFYVFLIMINFMLYEAVEEVSIL